MSTFHQLAKEFPGVAVYGIYITEAHSSDRWSVGLPFAPKEPLTLEERINVAEIFIKHVNWTLPLFIDSMDNLFRKTYAAWPTRFFLIHDNVIRFISQPHDSGHFHLGALVQVLQNIARVS